MLAVSKRRTQRALMEALLPKLREVMKGEG